MMVETRPGESMFFHRGQMKQRDTFHMQGILKVEPRWRVKGDEILERTSVSGLGIGAVYSCVAVWGRN